MPGRMPSSSPTALAEGGGGDGVKESERCQISRGCEAERHRVRNVVHEGTRVAQHIVCKSNAGSTRGC